MSNIDRRKFLTYVIGAAGIALVGRQVALAAPLRKDADTADAISRAIAAPTGGGRTADGLLSSAPREGVRKGMVIDSGACIGCRRCQYACKAENNVPDTIAPPWIEVFQMDNSVSFTGHPREEELRAGSTTSYTESPKEGKWYMPVQCNHCENPPCVRVCPTGATYKDPRDGLVLMDYDRCVGCRFCVVACPYNARRFNWVKGQIPQETVNPLVPVRPVGVVEKCTFCVHRTRDGKLPRCVEVCPVGARHFGDLNDPQSEVSLLLKANPGIRLLEELNTEPSLWYVTRGRKFIK